MMELAFIRQLMACIESLLSVSQHDEHTRVKDVQNCNNVVLDFFRDIMNKRTFSVLLTIFHSVMVVLTWPVSAVL